MCGIVGVIDLKERKANYADFLDSSLQSMNHRGPDSKGVLISDKYALGHARLAIQDTSDNGAQPMSSECGRYTLVFNGEIYDFDKFKDDLEKAGCHFKTHSDTEVLLAMLIHYGVKETTNKVNGMYAFCFIDNLKEKAFIARDFYGQKPLYYYIDDDVFIFSSTLSPAKMVKTQWNADNDALLQFINVGFVSQPTTAVLGVKQLPRNSFAVIDFKQEKLAFDLHDKNSNTILVNSGSYNISELIDESVVSMMKADVPVGVFLSGGVDSSIITYYANKQKTIDTFCVGFKNKDYDESVWAEKVADRLGTNHHCIYIDDGQIEDIVKSATAVFSEPFSDPSYIPTVALSEFARKKVKVVLTGDGGDELFYGYNRHIWASKLNKYEKLFQNKLVNRIVFSKYTQKFLTDKLNFMAIAEKIEKLKFLSNGNGGKSPYWRFLESPFNSFDKSFPLYQETKGLKEISEIVREMDIEFYQPSNTLVKTDSSTMFSGLEARAPFLDDRLISYIDENVSYKGEVQKGVGKLTLRQLANTLIGPDLMQRPKSGFTPPLVQWLQGPLNSWLVRGVSLLKKRYPNEFLDSSGVKSSNYMQCLYLWRCASLGYWLESNDFL